ncbi:hypothetical protein Nocox_05795 [Nonomuraea coxensis DSM 45129]|uniref:DUF4097 domain-containing protein n=1 Tax=Nonomuraea coxensis DSM 45129 TaxID=1122611 RepID=A0ABX8TU76_9ACTN|nr:DUF4097 family beta strand repeat-containing protein [Nonomuraea coxensis]QYC38786.1 hypothetical protein Nocox_05795 [Nonomuraea coxensis DSM 45129]
MTRLAALAASTALAALTALATAGCGGLDLDAEEVRSSRAFPVTGTTLKIVSSLGGVRVLPGSAGSVRVDRWVRGKAAGEGNATWSLRDGVLRLGADCSMIVGDCGARYHVEVPPAVHVTVEAPDGVTLKNLGQDVDAVSREHIQVDGASGRLRLRSDGPITGTALTSAAVRARTVDGAIDVTFVTAPADLDLESADGRVTATVPKGSYAVTARSRDGSVTSDLRSDPKASAVIVARSGTGNVRVRVP